LAKGVGRWQPAGRGFAGTGPKTTVLQSMQGGNRRR